MIYRALTSLCLILVITGCSTTGIQHPPGKILPNTSGYYAKKPVQCVPFAREASGIQIYGDAHTWWGKAQKNKRGKHPETGAVLVLAKTNRLKRGHLAVVKDVLSPRHIIVTHSNWGNDYKTRSFIYETMLVEDTSRNNDWSSMRFWNQYTNAYGSPYAAYGFIYP